MEDNQNKKVCDKESFVLWLIFIVIIVWVIMNHPMLIFALAAFVGIWYYFTNSQRKSADINEKEEIITEENATEFVKNSSRSFNENGDFSNKTDSFYSGISENSSINGKDK